MKITIEKLLRSKSVVEKLMRSEMPAAAAYDVMKMARAIGEELKLFEQARKNLFEKYGEENKETKNVQIKDENVEVFKTEMSDLMKKEVELKCQVLKVQALADVKMSVVDLMIMEGLIEE